MADSTKILFNGNCSKCRMSLDILHENKVDADIVEYLQSPPDFQELEAILTMLNMEPRQLMRSHEKEYAENNLGDESLSREQLIEAMITNPILIERPIVIHNGKAIIGRPPETILEIFK